MPAPHAVVFVDCNDDEPSRRSHLPDVDFTAPDQDAAAPAAHDPGTILVAAAVMACFARVP